MRSPPSAGGSLGSRACRSEPSFRAELRDARAGDFGWVIERHGAIYAEEYGWDTTFEALVAEIVAAFIRNRNPAREKCWIAERTFAWLSRFRRLARDFERYARTIAAFIRLAMIRIMLERLVANPSS